MHDKEIFPASLNFENCRQLLFTMAFLMTLRQFMRERQKHLGEQAQGAMTMESQARPQHESQAQGCPSTFATLMSEFPFVWTRLLPFAACHPDDIFIRHTYCRTSPFSFHHFLFIQ
jgi:hypothetical protein